jgi:hypothetical protein
MTEQQIPATKAPNCPECGRGDLQRVRAYISQNPSSTVAFNLQVPQAGRTFGKGSFILGALAILAVIWGFNDKSASPAVGILFGILLAAPLAIRYYLARLKRQASAEMRAVWNTLYYCATDDVVVSDQLPDAGAPSARWADLVAEVEGHTTSTR